MIRVSFRRWLSLASLPALALGLSACELRNTDEEVVEPVETAAPEDPEASATPTPEPSETARESIIRDDIQRNPAVSLPPEPLRLTIPFPDGSDLDENAERALASVLDSDALTQGWPVVLGGHTDSAGFDQANLRASRARAEAVAAWLVERGVADERIKVIAFGEQNPIAPNALPDGSPNEQGRATNRRVELTIAPPASRKPADKATQSGQAKSGA